MTQKQSKIVKRQELLTHMIPNAISCDYIASVDRKLPNGFEIKTINLNNNGYAWYMMAVKGKESKFFVSNDAVKIQGINVYYIIYE